MEAKKHLGLSCWALLQHCVNIWIYANVFWKIPKDLFTASCSYTKAEGEKPASVEVLKIYTL